METLRLTDIIGQEIKDIKYHYVSENEYGMQSFHCFIKLGNGSIIGIPKFDNNDYLLQSEENLIYFSQQYETGETIKDERRNIKGQKITDFYFSYYANEIDFDACHYIKLSNGYYLTENNYGPLGVTDVDLLIFNEEDFMKKTHESDIRSFLHTLL